MIVAASLTVDIAADASAVDYFYRRCCCYYCCDISWRIVISVSKFKVHESQTRIMLSRYPMQMNITDDSLLIEQLWNINETEMMVMVVVACCCCGKSFWGRFYCHVESSSN